MLITLSGRGLVWLRCRNYSVIFRKHPAWGIYSLYFIYYIYVGWRTLLNSYNLKSSQSWWFSTLQLKLGSLVFNAASRSDSRGFLSTASSSEAQRLRCQRLIRVRTPQPGVTSRCWFSRRTQTLRLNESPPNNIKNKPSSSWSHLAVCSVVLLHTDGCTDILLLETFCFLLFYLNLYFDLMRKTPKWFCTQFMIACWFPHLWTEGRM